MRAIVLLLSSAACCVSTIASAQETGNASGSASDSASEVAVEEILVTAQRRSESAQNVPISISAVSGETIFKTATPDLATLTVSTPTVRVSQSATSDQLFIRGIGSGVNPGFEQSVGTFIDGVYFGRGRQSVGQFVDIERVEVLKGPQSTYFGNSTIAGALNITTRRPSSELEVDASALYEFNHNELDLRSAVNIPLSEAVSVRFAGNYRSIDGWLRNTYLDRRQTDGEYWVARGSIAAELSDRTSAVLKVEGSRIDEFGSNFQIVNCPGIPGVAGGRLGCNTALATAIETGFEDIFDTNVQVGTLGPVPNPAFAAENYIHEQDGLNVVLNVDHHLGDGWDLALTTGYVEYQDLRVIEGDGYPAAIVILPRHEDYDQLSQEVRISSEQGRTFEIIGGVYAQTSNLDFLERFIVNLGGGSATHVQHHQDERTLSAFAAATWNVSDTLNATFGLRYSEVNKAARHEVDLFAIDEVGQISAGSRTFVAQNLGIFESPLVRVEDTFKDLVPSFAVQWTPMARLMFYASYAEGFKSGGFDALLRSNPANAADFARRLGFDSETVNSYEAGVKSTILDGQLRLNAAVFRSDYRNLQVSTFDGLGGFLVGNAGRARTQGIDFEAQAAISRDFSFSLSASYLDAFYPEFNGAPCRTIGARPDPNTPGACTQTGESLMYAPDFSGSASLDYSHDISNDYSISAYARLNFTDGFFTAADNNPNSYQDSYAKVDLRVALEATSGWEVAVIGRNITNILTFSQKTGIPLSAGSYNPHLERPRSIAVQASYRY